MMPSALGLAVKTDLQRCRNHDAGPGVGPIISHVRSGRWSFLVEPNIPDDTALFAEMFRLNVSIVRTGATIALPSPSDRGELFRRWIHLPPCDFRPSGLTVIDSIRACAARTTWRSIPMSAPGL
ncbi:DNA-directed RNA polymerase subunit beta [Nocardia sp. NPDC059180]|uniref:DNA-directed RNA polymerase subunit beta n=1 Tax=Nocardia sp. NPDC059180 TaxID=3346761 RepID=UPI0036890E4A